MNHGSLQNGLLTIKVRNFRLNFMFPEVFLWRTADELQIGIKRDYKLLLNSDVKNVLFYVFVHYSSLNILTVVHIHNSTGCICTICSLTERHVF